MSGRNNNQPRAAQPRNLVPAVAKAKAGPAKVPRPVAPKAGGPKGRPNNVAPAAPLPAPVAPDPIVGLPPGLGLVPPPERGERRYKGFRKASDEWAPEAERDGATWNYLRSLGVTPREPVGNSYDINVHPSQAAERSIATARALGMLHSKGVRHVAGIYGSERDEGIVNFCNRHEARVEDQLKYVRYSPTITAKDFLRKPTTITFGDAMAQAECILLVDVYETLVDLPGPLTPGVIARMFEAMPNPFGGPKLVWVGRKFYGDAGVVANEAAWIRLPDGKISYRSSVWEGSEYVHDPCDWMWQGSVQSIRINGQPARLSWTMAKPVGSMLIVSFNVALGVVDSSAGYPLYEFEKMLLEVSCPNTGGWASNLIAVVPHVPQSLHGLLPVFQKRLIFKPLFQIAKREAVNKRFNQINFDRVSRALISGMEDQTVKLFYTIFPSLNLRFELAPLVWGIILDDINERHCALLAVNTFQGATMAAINHLQASIGAPPSPVEPVGWLRYLIGAGALTAFFILWKARRWLGRLATTLSRFIVKRPRYTAAVWEVTWPLSRFLPHTAWNPAPHEYMPVNQQRLLGWSINECIFAPVGEEAFKRLGGALSSYFKIPIDLGLVLPLFELWQYSRHAGIRHGRFYWRVAILDVAVRLLVFWFHMKWMRMPFLQGVMYHSMWNSVGARAITLALDVLIGDRASTFVHTASLLGGVKVLLGLLACAGLMTVFMSYLRTKLNTKTGAYARWKEAYYMSDWADRAVYQTNESFIDEIDDFRVPEQDSGLELSAIDLQLLDGPNENIRGEHLLHADGIYPLRSTPKQPSYFYHLLPTCAPGFVPAASDQNLRVAIAYRLLTRPPLHPATQRVGWTMARNSFRKHFISLIPQQQPIGAIWDLIVDDWLEHFEDAAKQHYYRAIVRRIRSGDFHYSWESKEDRHQCPEHTSLFVKHDEMLMQQKDGVYIMKPRIIANVPSEFQARVGPYVYTAQKRLGTIWDEQPRETEPITLGGRQYLFHVMTGGGKTDVNLSVWMNHVIERVYVPVMSSGFCILVCGDDSVVAFCVAFGPILFFEGDARMFDQSESFGPLDHQADVLQRLGVSKLVTNLIRNVSANTYVVRPHVRDGDRAMFSLNRHERPMRDTGGADTYIGNTIIMASAWFFVLCEVTDRFYDRFIANPVAECMRAFQHLGFDMKLKQLNHAMDVTFLKGLWYPVVSEQSSWCWGPLPSRILKIGKCLRDPRSIYHLTDPKQAAGRFLADVSSSYSVFLPVPIVRAFVSRYQDDYIMHAAEAVVSRYGAQADGSLRAVVLDSSAMEGVCRRYDITFEDILRVEKMLYDSKPLNFLNDPVFLRLAEVDYA